MADLRGTLAARLGCTAGTTDHDLILALDQALGETRAVPDGVELLDRDTVAQLRADAERGRTSRHDSLITDAVRTGKIPPASRHSWATLLETDPHAEKALAGLKTGLIPVSPAGYSRVSDEREAGPPTF